MKQNSANFNNRNIRWAWLIGRKMVDMLRLQKNILINKLENKNDKDFYEEKLVLQKHEIIKKKQEKEREREHLSKNKRKKIKITISLKKSKMKHKTEKERNKRENVMYLIKKDLKHYNI